MKNISKILFAFVLVAALSFGQASMASTTLGAAVTTTNQTTITLASTSTMTGSGAGNQINTVLYVDKEFMRVLTVTDSTHVVVQRAQGIGASARPATHASGATVYFAITTTSGPAASYFSNGSLFSEVTGSCTASNLLVIPVIYLSSGNAYDCLGSQWVQTNAPGKPTLGTTVASPAGLLTATGTVFTVSGTNAITGINVPKGWAPGMSLYILPSGTFTWTTATNIALAGTAVVGKVIIFTWNGTSWFPSVVA